MNREGRRLFLGGDVALDLVEFLFKSCQLGLNRLSLEHRRREKRLQQAVIGKLCRANDADCIASLDKARGEHATGCEQSLADWFAVGAQISKKVGGSGVSVLASPV